MRNHKSIRHAAGLGACKSLYESIEAYNATLNGYSQLAKYLGLIALFLTVILLQNSSAPDASSIDSNLKGQFFTTASGAVDSSTGKVVTEFANSVAIYTWLREFVDTVFQEPMCNDLHCDGPEEFPSWWPFGYGAELGDADKRAFSPCYADCSIFMDPTKLAHVKVDFFDVAKLQAAFNKYDQMISNGGIFGRLPSEWGMGERPIAGWNICSRDRTEYGFLDTFCIFNGDVIIDGLPYRVDELDTADSSFGGVMEFELFFGNWELRIAYDKWNLVGEVDLAYPAVRGSLQFANMGSEFGDPEVFAPCPEADQCGGQWYRGVYLRKCRPMTYEEYIWWVYVDPGWEPDTSLDDVEWWNEDQYLLCMGYSDPVLLLDQNYVVDPFGAQIKALFRTKNYTKSMASGEMSPLELNMDVLNWALPDLANDGYFSFQSLEQLAELGMWWTLADMGFNGSYYWEFGLNSRDNAEPFWAADGYCDAFNNNIFGAYDAGDCCCITCTDPTGGDDTCVSDSGGCGKGQDCNGPASLVNTTGWDTCNLFGAVDGMLSRDACGLENLALDRVDITYPFMAHKAVRDIITYYEGEDEWNPSRIPSAVCPDCSVVPDGSSYFSVPFAVDETTSASHPTTQALHSDTEYVEELLFPALATSRSRFVGNNLIVVGPLVSQTRYQQAECDQKASHFQSFLASKDLMCADREASKSTAPFGIDAALSESSSLYRATNWEDVLAEVYPEMAAVLMNTSTLILPAGFSVDQQSGRGTNVAFEYPVVLDVNFNNSRARDFVTLLDDGGYIDSLTSSLNLKLVTYNPAAGLWTLLHLSWVPQIGGTWSFVRTTTVVDLDLYYTAEDGLRTVVELCFGALLCAFIAQEVNEMHKARKTTGRMLTYFQSKENIFDLMVYGLLVVSGSVWMVTYLGPVTSRVKHDISIDDLYKVGCRRLYVDYALHLLFVADRCICCHQQRVGFCPHWARYK